MEQIYYYITSKYHYTMKNLISYIEIDWSGVCSDFDLEYGDISPEQTFEIDHALHKINEVLNEFIIQNQ